MGTRFEYINVTTAGVEYTDERNLAVENPEAQNVLAVGYDEALVFTGTQEQLLNFANRIIGVLMQPPIPYEEPKECRECHDPVDYVNSDGLCDGCVEEQEQLTHALEKASQSSGIIALARSLAPEGAAENPEYLRALVELTVDTLGLTSDDARDRIRSLITANEAPPPKQS